VPPPPRLTALDAFRGLTILAMLLVNNIALDAATPRQLRHADWSGRVHLADLVFPWFLLIVGIAVPYASATRTPVRFVRKALERAAGLFVLGCLVTSAVDHRLSFGLGVLQLIALAYLVTALLHRLTPWVRLGVALSLLIGHWALLRFVPAPGLDGAVFAPGQTIVDHLNRTHLEAWSLRGLISVIPTAGLCLLGATAGDVLRSEHFAPHRKLLLLVIGGMALTAIGMLWSHDLPMNKPLWTAPYICYSAGLGLLILTAFTALTDRGQNAVWAQPLVVAGRNATVAYVAPILVKVLILQQVRWPGSESTIEQGLQDAAYGSFGRVGGGWVYTVGYLVVWWVVLYGLHRKGWYLRL
jgi:predicted acyltransferase